MRPQCRGVKRRAGGVAYARMVFTGSQSATPSTVKVTGFSAEVGTVIDNELVVSGSGPANIKITGTLTGIVTVGAGGDQSAPKLPYGPHLAPSLSMTSSNKVALVDGERIAAWITQYFGQAGTLTSLTVEILP